MSPYFSIIIPMYNRESCIERAIDSCLSQGFTDFEIIVVDDGSTDGSCARVQRKADDRIRLITHPANRGRCPARNTGMAAARGRWFVFLDSDDELIPGALEVMHQHAESLPADVGGMRFMCRDDRGRAAPDPPLQGDIWDYEAYLRWLEVMWRKPAEALPCARADTYPDVQFPDDHSEEMLYHLDLAKRWRILASASIVRLYHYDADNRITVPRAERSLRYAPDAADNARQVLERHGIALREWAPRTAADVLERAALWSLLAGRRDAALRYALQSRTQRGMRPALLVILAAGLVSRHALAWLQQLNNSMRARFGQ